MLFRGITSINLDTKGRMAIPMRYRDDLQVHCKNQLVVTIDTDERCLLLYPLPDWEKIEAQIEALPSFNPVTRRIQRLLIGHATETELDAQGRIMLPPLLREYAVLDKQIVLVGQGKKFEVWSDASWQSRRDEWLQAEAKNPAGEWPESLQSLSL